MKKMTISDGSKDVEKLLHVQEITGEGVYYLGHR
jgi:hypothetical protein